MQSMAIPTVALMCSQQYNSAHTATGKLYLVVVRSSKVLSYRSVIDFKRAEAG